MPAETVLLDTDIGSDIDDAFCLAYLLANPGCELAGITTVSGQPQLRARLASALCTAAGRNVPIVPGAEAPLGGEQRQPNVPQAAVLDRWPHSRDFPIADAVAFMAEAIASRPGEVTLLAIGPQTNVAELFARYPDTAAALKRLVLMAGRFGPPPAGRRAGEWNVYCDPRAADAVYRAPVADHRSIGLDVTLQVQMDRGDVGARAQHPLLQIVMDMAAAWFRERPVVTFHDPLTAVSLFHPEVCGFERGTVSVDTSEGPDQGETRWTPGPAGPHQVATTVRPDVFFDSYFGVFAPA